MTKRAAILLLFATVLFGPAFATAESSPGTSPDFEKHVLPMLNKYCTGCHNTDDVEGKLVIESYSTLMAGGQSGPALLPGDSANSRIIRVLTGESKISMPPKGNPRPSAAEIATLRAWIEAGAKGPPGETVVRDALLVPKIPVPAGMRRPVTAVAWSPDGRWIAVGRYRAVELISPEDGKTGRTLAGLAGKVTSLRFTADSRRLMAASGVAGLSGSMTIWSVADGKLLGTLGGHRDLAYGATATLDGRMYATAGYDRDIFLWNSPTDPRELVPPKLTRTLKGHNDAVYDLAFSPDGKVLASASGDSTVKLWNTRTGERLDTLNQPLKEQYTVTFTPDGKQIVAAGADNRIRVWQFVSRERPALNPLLIVRFAHEAPIVRLALSHDGRRLASISEDRTIKIWETAGYTPIRVLPRQADLVASADFSPDGQRLLVGRMDGTWEILSISGEKAAASPAVKHVVPQMLTQSMTPAIPAAAVVRGFTAAAERGSIDSTSAKRSHQFADATLPEAAEVEPNDLPVQATVLVAPFVAAGTIEATQKNKDTDVDLYRFKARKGESWIIETRAARDKSPLDTRLEVLDASGKPVLRMQLRAVRDSYFTFRGMDSLGDSDFRLFNGGEMKRNDYIYANGEVVRLHSYPQGADSGYWVYPNQGRRFTFFDTTPITHALNETCYVVEPVPAGETPTPNGLPIFPIYYRNDDESTRQMGTDSLVHFTAPADGEYLIQVADARGFEGPKYKYRLTVRRPQPDFEVRLEETNPRINPGSARKFTLKAIRKDGFDGEIRVDVANLPPGFSATTPVVVEAGQIVAYGMVMATADAPQTTAVTARQTSVSATATVDGRKIVHAVNGFGEIKLAAAAQLQVWLEPPRAGDAISTIASALTTAEKKKAVNDGKAASEKATGKVEKPIARSPAAPLHLTIHPGETITAQVCVARVGFQGAITFGRNGAGFNLPHGVYVDNIGLNGVFVPEDADERTIFITADRDVQPQTRTFFLQSQQVGNPTTQPIILHVRSRDEKAKIPVTR